MKYFITLAILVIFGINAGAQTTAGGDDKAFGASIGKCNGYTYGTNYTIVKGQVTECCSENNVCHMETKVSADKELKAADLKTGRYSYEVSYTASSREIVRSDKK